MTPKEHDWREVCRTSGSEREEIQREGPGGEESQDGDTKEGTAENFITREIGMAGEPQGTGGQDQKTSNLEPNMKPEVPLTPFFFFFFLILF